MICISDHNLAPGQYDFALKWSGHTIHEIPGSVVVGVQAGTSTGVLNILTSGEGVRHRNNASKCQSCKTY